MKKGSALISATFLDSNGFGETARPFVRKVSALIFATFMVSDGLGEPCGWFHCARRYCQFSMPLHVSKGTSRQAVLLRQPVVYSL